MKNILLVEDDAILSRNISDALLEENMQVEFAYDGNIAEKMLKKTNFDCVILDVNLPGKNGYKICKNFRSYNTQTPVIMLTAFDELEDKIQGYDCGADDYLTKPFYMRELLLRIQSLLKRSENLGKNEFENNLLVADDIVINNASKKVTRQGKEVQLTPREFQILLKLVECKGELVSKQDLVKEIWGNIVDANTNTIEVYINFLRGKLDKPFGKQSIKTKIGYGYYFDSE
ncbi:response regulator transcription factor [Fluviicola taffensis]|uniref:Two component transcriptional regulator, winged helix family n=1 Tax=Fluviicola taffensis (strain DSM 16823 / NCIMB 13979 / RW262) TaxID=755732 RepID=F2IB25_FLUTR|nr:response regulator transcription factor [Fluviicola taffensis]AEA42108.1 two component transcriptional regulator, winged helix family [Fluviicola taffensis DSM 16823]